MQTKRILAVLLALCLLVSTVPAMTLFASADSSLVASFDFTTGSLTDTVGKSATITINDSENCYLTEEGLYLNRYTRGWWSDANRLSQSDLDLFQLMGENATMNIAFHLDSLPESRCYIFGYDGGWGGSRIRSDALIRAYSDGSVQLFTEYDNGTGYTSNTLSSGANEIAAGDNVLTLTQSVVDGVTTTMIYLNGKLIASSTSAISLSYLASVGSSGYSFGSANWDDNKPELGGTFYKADFYRFTMTEQQVAGLMTDATGNFEVAYANWKNNASMQNLETALNAYDALLPDDAATYTDQYAELAVAAPSLYRDKAEAAVNALQAVEPSTAPSYKVLLDAAAAAIVAAETAGAEVTDLAATVTQASETYTAAVAALVKLDNSAVVTSVSGDGSPWGDGPFANAFDSSDETKLGGSPITSISWSVDAPYMVVGYSLTTGYDASSSGRGRCPGSWTLEASADGANYEVIDTVARSGMEDIDSKEYQYLLENPGLYQHFKITFGSSSTVALNEISLYTVPAPVAPIDATFTSSTPTSGENGIDLTWNVSLVDGFDDAFATFNATYDIVDAGVIVAATTDDLDRYSRTLAESENLAAKEPGLAYKESFGTTVYSNFSYRRTNVQEGRSRYIAVYITYTDGVDTQTLLVQGDGLIAQSE